jgi:peptide/nickel transport system ATP-binding protein
MRLLEINGLTAQFDTVMGTAHAVAGVTLSLDERETVGLVGESGCGKSVTALSIMRLLSAPGRVVSGEVKFRGRDLTTLSNQQMRLVRGKEIAMIFQEPMSSLNPVLRIGHQITENVRVHLGMSRAKAWARAVEMLDRVGIPDAARRAHDYPHVLSGGMRQRVMIAMALACEPSLLIADEPTTALDVTVQAQILDLLRDLQAEFGMSMLLITHDLGVVADICDRVAVMYAGRIVEQGRWQEMFRSPQHPYTEGLIKSIPQLNGPKGQRLDAIPGQVPNPFQSVEGCHFAPRCEHRSDRCAQTPPLFDLGTQRSACWLCAEGRRSSTRVVSTGGAPVADGSANPSGAANILLRVENLRTHFPVGGSGLWRKKRTLKAVDGVDLAVRDGESFGLVGESGCGKSTFGRSILRLVEPTSGHVRLGDMELGPLSRRQLRSARAQMQLIFQDPVASLNPRLPVETIVGEALRVHGVSDAEQRRKIVTDTLMRVGLRADDLRKYPHEFSGGQRQRIGIARALVLSPKLVVADEPVSALDVSVQSQVLNLMANLKREFGLTYLFIAHDLSVVRHISDRVAVMYLGKIVELASTDDLYQRPAHPYTRALLSAVPDPDPARRRPRTALTGDVPSPVSPPTGCRFRTRCPLARGKNTQDGLCAEVEPPLIELRPGHLAACHFPESEPC